METLYRIGTFFILVGLALLIIFVISIIGRETHGIYLFLSFTSFVLGFLLHRNKVVNESGRFGTIRRMGERNRLRRQEGMKRPARGNPLAGRRHPSAQRDEGEEENDGNGCNSNE